MRFRGSEEVLLHNELLGPERTSSASKVRGEFSNERVPGRAVNRLVKSLVGAQKSCSVTGFGSRYAFHLSRFYFMPRQQSKARCCNAGTGDFNLMHGLEYLTEFLSRIFSNTDPTPFTLDQNALRSQP